VQGSQREGMRDTAAASRDTALEGRACKIGPSSISSCSILLSETCSRGRTSRITPSPATPQTCLRPSELGQRSLQQEVISASI
jgi:hypothetical protein